jgi:hypothetical protein
LFWDRRRRLKWISYFNNIAIGFPIFSLTGSNLHCRGKMSFPSYFLKFVIPKSPYQIAMTKSDFRINNPQLWITKASTDVFIYRVERDKQLDAPVNYF